MPGLFYYFSGDGSSVPSPVSCLRKQRGIKHSPLLAIRGKQGMIFTTYGEKGIVLSFDYQIDTIQIGR